MRFRSVWDPLTPIPYQPFIKHTVSKSHYASFSLKVGIWGQWELSLSNMVHKIHTNWATLKLLMPIRSSLWLLSLCNNRINQHSAGSWWIQGHIVLRKALSDFSLILKKACVRGHVAVFLMLFLWNLSSQKQPAVQNIWNGAPRSFHCIPQSLAVNTAKMLPGCIQTCRSPVLCGCQRPCAPFPFLWIRQIAWLVVLWDVMDFWMNRNGMIIYLLFTFFFPATFNHLWNSWFGSAPDQ